MSYNKITESIIGCAIKVHRALGFGVLESAYEECLLYELRAIGYSVQKQVSRPIVYKDNSPPLLTSV